MDWKIHVRDNGQDAPMIVEFFGLDRLSGVHRMNWRPRVIYDLGANIGIASLSMATLCPQAQIFGFEPVPANFEICRLNYDNLPRALVCNCAVGATSGTQQFEFNPQDPRAGKLSDDLLSNTVSSETGVQVEVWSIADLIQRKGFEPPDFLKIDVEGAELDVLKGLGIHAKSVKEAHVETHSPELKARCSGWFHENGFLIQEDHSFAGGLGSLWAKRA
jgi:FkbM family methyltransferase